MDQLLCFYLLLIEECISTMSGLPCQETTILYCHFLTAAHNLELLRVWDLITVMMIMNVNYIARFWVLKDIWCHRWCIKWDRFSVLRQAVVFAALCMVTFNNCRLHCCLSSQMQHWPENILYSHIDLTSSRRCEATWEASSVCVPVISNNSKHRFSYGTGLSIGVYPP